MKTLAFYVDIARDEACRIAVDAAARARSNGFGVALCDGQDEILHLADGFARVEQAMLLVTIGGDGTLLRGARIAYPDDTPLLGINTGRLGFLTELDGNPSAAEALIAIAQNGFEIEERTALEVTIAGRDSFIALNDAVVRKGTASRIVPFGLELDGEHVAKIPADGVVVATPTGSTAYFLSAGGPIVSPQVECFGIAALMPHTLFTRPLIVPTSSTIEVTLDSEIVHANLEVDGETVADLSPGDRVTIRRAPKPIRFARSEPLRFFSRLERKLHWGASIAGFTR